MRSFLVVASLALAGCTQHPEPCPLWIDSGFSPEARQGIERAVAAWNDLHVYVYLTPMADQVEPHLIEPISSQQMAAELQSHDIVPEERGACVCDITGEAHNERIFWGWKHPPIRLLPENIDPMLVDYPNAYIAAAMHELGHHFGLGHTGTPGDIMNKHVPLDLDYVTPEAAHRWQEMYPDGNQ